MFFPLRVCCVGQVLVCVCVRVSFFASFVPFAASLLVRLFTDLFFSSVSSNMASGGSCVREWALARTLRSEIGSPPVSLFFLACLIFLPSLCSLVVLLCRCIHTCVHVCFLCSFHLHYALEVFFSPPLPPSLTCFSSMSAL